MLCQQCQAREATIHFSALAWPSGEDTNHFCENCYPQAEAERAASYNPKPKPAPVIDVERITASQYLDFAAKAHANSSDAPTYRRITEELKRFPATRGRLATEMLTMALQSLQNGSDSWHLIMLGTCFVNAVPAVETHAFIELLEKILLRSVELMARSPTAPSLHPFGLGLRVAGNVLRRCDPGRFSMLLRDLKARNPGSAPSRAVLDYLEQHMAGKTGSDI